MSDIKLEINEIFDEDSVASWRTPYFKVYSVDSDKSEAEIHFGCEYEPPKLNFLMLKKLGDLFGTYEINVDNYDSPGCETCDFGSDYGHKIFLKKITKNFEFLRANLKKDLFGG